MCYAKELTQMTYLSAHVGKEKQNIDIPEN